MKLETFNNLVPLRNCHEMVFRIKSQGDVGSILLAEGCHDCIKLVEVEPC